MNPVIMNTDDNAATYRMDISGWVSRNGYFYGNDEQMARRDGCTHVPCAVCDEPVEKTRMYCGKCREAHETSCYNARPRRAWDGRAMLYSDAIHRYFDDLKTAEDGLEEGQTLGDLRLVICEPVYLRQIDDDHWADDLCDDEELPEAVGAALEALNVAIREAGPVSWEPGKFAVDLSLMPKQQESKL